MQTTPIEQAEGRLAEVIDKQSPGEEVILTRDDKPVATLRATAPPSPREPPRLGTLKGTISPHRAGF
jgi:antitoxin (DNA-binding transcriptional repressor) of toxin-antitoxin stability system